MLIPPPWCGIVETQSKMEKKMEFVEKYLLLSAKMSKERKDVLKHHIHYVQRQHNMNLKEEDLLEKKKLKHYKGNQENTTEKKRIERIKYKPGGGPSRDRKIVNEKYNLSLEQIQEIRKNSHYFCQKNVSKIEIEKKEKIRNLMLPLIKNQ